MALKPLIAGSFYDKSPASSPGGATTLLQFNNAGSFGGITGWSTNGTNALIGSAAGLVSSPVLSLTGAWFTGGSATTTKPQLLIEPAGAATTNWSTSGTGLGINAANGFTGRLIDAQVNAVSKVRVDSVGNVFAVGGFYCESTLGSGNRTVVVENNSGIEGRIYLNSTGVISLSSSSADAGTGRDSFITRAAAGVINLTAISGSTQALSGAGAVNVTTRTTKYTSTGVGQALTLADGVDGQEKIIVHEVDGGSGVLTPTTATGFTTITFTNAGESAYLVFCTTRGWIIVALNGAVAA